VKTSFFQTLGSYIFVTKRPTDKTKYVLETSFFFCFLYVITFDLKLRLCGLNEIYLQHPAPVLALILYGWVEGGGVGRTGDRMIKDLKNLAVTCLGWGQYKMYKSIIIIINFIS
jgi:hypothetical protein